MNRKTILVMAICILLSLLYFPESFAKEVEKEKEWKPLDLVIIIDSSGSMKYSDPNRTALEAVRMLVNMMPAQDSRVAIVGFNTSATVLSRSPSDGGALIGLKDFQGVETIRSEVSAIEYDGGTGIGNALKAATDVLEKESNVDRSKAIILFTDGRDDLKNQLSLSICESNEAEAIFWAKTNICPIYCVGYDYVDRSGNSSMGPGGEGLKKLQNIAEGTDGVFNAITDIDSIKQNLIDFLADVCDLYYRKIAIIQGDGGYYEVPIPISPSVVEANIRISGGDENAIKSGKIHLYEPGDGNNGKEVQLTNSGNIRFDVDVTAASIKIIMPKAGDWLLTIEGITGGEIEVGLLEHFKVNLKCVLVFPDSNPEGVAYTNDIIGIKAWLTYDGQDIQNSDFYDAVTSATAECVSRQDENDKKTVNLTREGFSFVGSFVIPQDSAYDVKIRLEWDSIYREDTLEIKSDNKPLQLVSNIPDVKVNKGKTVTLDNIYQYVYDEERDEITVRVEFMSPANVVDIKFDNDKAMITGVKGWWAKTNVTFEYKDAQGNTVSTIFKVSVGDPWAAAIIGGIVLLVLLLVFLVIYALIRATVKIPGEMKIALLAKGIVDSSGNFHNKEEIYRNPNALKANESPVEPPRGRQGGGAGNGPFGGVDSAFGGSAFGDDDDSPFGGSGGSAFGGSGGSAFGEDSQLDDSGNGVFGDESSVAEDALKAEKQQSDRFNVAITLRDRFKKKSLYVIACEFLEKYKKLMCGNGSKSILYNGVENFINDAMVKAALSRIMVYGTAPFGANGMVLKRPKMLSKNIIFHSPTFTKKTTLKKRVYLITVSIVCGPKDEGGNTPVFHISIRYSNL